MEAPVQIHHTVKKVTKRNGELVDFDPQKIYAALRRAVDSLGGVDMDRVMSLTKQVVREIEKNYYQPTVEDVQDTVEKVLMSNGHVQTAKAYILYRHKRKEQRDERKDLLDGLTTTLKLPPNALVLLRERYLLRRDGKLAENPEQLFTRVAKHVAQAELKYGGHVDAAEDAFHEVLYNQLFVPSSAILMNAGTAHAQLSACYAIPIRDSVEDIFTALKNQAIIQQNGGGTGFNFSRIRPAGDKVRGLSVAAGPIALMRHFDLVAQSIRQGGKRQGANMGILRVDHPDILSFITLKQDGVSLNNFNISVGLTEEFMDAVEKNADFNLCHPSTGEVTQTINARHIFDLLILNAWKTGDPGIVFLDRMKHSRANPLVGYKAICATSPCAEQPLYEYESAVLGSINLGMMYADGQVNWHLLRETVHTAVHFLDNAIDVNVYPLPQAAVIARQTRRIGVGVMGFADLLFQLEMPYDSDEAVDLARKLMRHISECADEKSRELAKERGAFPLFNHSVYKHGDPIRNASRTTISPTGSTSLIAGASSSTDPVFSLSYKMRVLGDKEFIVVNPHFERAAHKYGFYAPSLMKEVAQTVSIQNNDEIPANVKRVFKVAFDVAPQWHVKMQAAFQQFTDNAISKTVNFPSWATTRDVEEVFFLAYRLGVKGITIYRDKSKENQVIGVNIEQPVHDPAQAAQVFFCHECDDRLIEKDNTLTCPSCGFSKCRV